MAVVRRTLQFLPAVFQTDVNRKFLGSTLDQLISEPEFIRIEGYVGRRFGTVPSNFYLEEPSQERSNYQLEPTVVSGSGPVSYVGDYADTVNKLRYYGAITDRHDRLFRSDYYSFDPHINWDSFVNYSQYHWLPNGPSEITVGSQDVSSATSYTFTATGGGYTTNQTGAVVNPTLTLVRGRTYTFAVNEPGKGFWIQTESGISGTREYNPNISTREQIMGVANNGTAVGTVTFTVPAAHAQDSYYLKPFYDYVDYATSATFTSIDGQPWISGVTVIDGDMAYPQDRLICFTTTSNASGDWTTRTGATVNSDQRRGIWRIHVNVFGCMELSFVTSIPTNAKVLINHGSTNQGREFYYTGTVLSLLAEPTASLTTLYYQNDTDDYKAGRIDLVDEDTDVIDVDNDIVGQTNYTHNGLVFSSGMKIKFDDTVTPSGYRNRSFIVEGVGTAIELVDFDLLVAPEVETAGAGIPFDSVPFDSQGFDQSTNSSVDADYLICARNSLDQNAWSRANRWFHVDVIRASAEYNQQPVDLGQRALRPIIEFQDNLQLFNMGRVGMGWVDLVFDSATTLLVNGRTEYLNDISSQIIYQTFKLLEQQSLELVSGQLVVFAADVNQATRARKYRVDYQDQSAAITFDGTLTGAVTLRAGQVRAISHSANTDFLTELRPGTELFTAGGAYLGRVAQIYNEYEFDFETAPVAMANEVTGLQYCDARVALTQVDIALDHSVLVTRSGSNRGKSYKFLSGSWSLCQQKTMVNQAPLFDVIMPVSANSISTEFYNSKFVGTKVFSYKTGNQVDLVLSMPVSYSNGTGSIGDLQFVNLFDTDSFESTQDISGVNRVIQSVNLGFLRQNLSRYEFNRVNCWSKVAGTTRQYQHIRSQFTGETNYFEIGVVPVTAGTQPSDMPNLRVYINNQLVIKNPPDQATDSYQLQTVGAVRALVIRSDLLAVSDIVDIFVLSDSASDQAYYEIPRNLEFNPLNQDITELTLGQVRNHVIRQAENLQGITGSPMGANNLRDINTDATAGTLLQHAAPVTMSTAMIMDSRVNFFNSLDYARREYTRFKNRFLELSVATSDVPPSNPASAVDLVLARMNAVKNKDFAFYYSDMLAHGDDYRSIIYTVANTMTTTYAISRSALNQDTGAILVYHNGDLLMRGRDYEFSASPVIVLKITLSLNDSLEIREYASTDGSFIPETPTKLGLHAAYRPIKYNDNTYLTDRMVIQGHDGSLTPAFGDFRDDLLLELETRIYNNLKINHAKSAGFVSALLPGKFRDTDYTLAEFNSVLLSEFLRWVGTNQIDYAANSSFVNNDEFSWNFRRSRDIDGEYVPGHWRGIYRYYYDTDRPHTHPWEIMGYAVKPDWWDLNYSWTNNTKRTDLIAAIVAGHTQDPGSASASLVDPVYRRPSFARYVPVDSAGNLRSPLTFITEFNQNLASSSWTLGDHGPVETAWRRSSEYPFAVQRALALLRPSYFALFADVSRYGPGQINNLDQYFYGTSNTRPGPEDYMVNGLDTGTEIQRATGYLNWVSAYLTSLGINGASRVSDYLKSLSVRLSHKLAGFSDQRYLNVLTEQYSPGSTNQSVIIPDESYRITLNTGSPKDTVRYSAVIVQRTPTGFSVSGYDQGNPFFNIVPSRTTGSSYSVTVLDLTVAVFTEFEDSVLAIPYGTEFSTRQQLADFLISYQRYLTSRGVIFDDYDTELLQVRDFTLSIREFLTWSAQGWRENTVIVLSPINDSLNVFSDQAQVDHIKGHSSGSRLLGVNFNPIRKTDFSVIRDGYVTKVYTVSGQTIALAELDLVQFEHVAIFDNHTIFNDIIYEPALGSRQLRLKFVGGITDRWDGQYTPPGFIYNDSQVPLWMPGTDYKKGDIVSYKTLAYSAVSDLAAVDSFDFNSWYKLDSVPNSGLLNNFATNAAMFDNIYDIDNPPINEEIFKFSMGLTGFRERDYLTNLGIDPLAQTKFYQGFIKEKGTASAAGALARARVDGISGDITVYEEWAARVGEYGSVDASASVKLILSDNITYIDPVTVRIASDVGDDSDPRITTMETAELISSPRDFTGNLFRYRDPLPVDTIRIELFGDGIMCGRDPYYGSPVGFIACLQDKVLGRVPNPPDSLLFDQLSDLFKVSVTTRSREYSTSGQLLAGTDGVNAAWPDDIEADIIIINHGLMDARFGTSLTQYKQNLTDLRNRVRADQTVIWMTPTPIDTANAKIDWTLSGGSVDIAAYAAAMRSVAAVYGDIVADAYKMPNWLYYLRNQVTISYASTTVVPGGDISFTINGPDTETIYYYNIIDPSAVAFDAYTGYTVIVEDNSLDPAESISITVTGPDAGVTLFYTIEPATAEDLARDAAGADYSDGVYPRQEGYTALVEQVLAPAVTRAIRQRQRAMVPYYPDELPTAGYVNADDVDAQLFDIANYKQFGNQIIQSVTNGFKIWVARDFDRNWQVYRLFRNPGQVTEVLSDLDRRVIFVCNNQHNLVTGDFFAIKGMNDTVDGFYQVYTSDEFTITVIADDIYETVRNFAIISDSAVIYDFQPLRFASLAARDAAKPKHGWIASDIAWVDQTQDTINSWAVYARADKYTIAASSQLLPAGSDLDFTVNSPISEEVDVYYTVVNPYTISLTGNTLNTNQTVVFKIDSPIREEKIFYTIQNAINIPRVETLGLDMVLENQPDWTMIRQQQPRVDIDSAADVFIYSNRSQKILTRVDLLDPAKGRLLGTAQADLDYVVDRDPAKYNTGTNDELSINTDFYWASDYLGRYWWNTDSARYVNYEQGSLSYRLDHWAELFPGSQVQVYQWIESDVTPAEHVELGRAGTPAYADNSAYSTHAFVNPENNVVTVRYYFWVSGLRSAAENKTHSVHTLAEIIENPRLLGIPYLAPLDQNAFAVYNVETYLSGSDSVLHIGFNTQGQTSSVHAEYKLVQAGRADSALPDRVLNKLIDSLCGMDSAQASVPDVRLNSYERIGLGLRPRQTLIQDRRLAVENLIRYVNSILIQHPVASRIIDQAGNTSDRFYAHDPEPSSNDYDVAVDQYRSDTVSDLRVPVPRPSLRVLVRSDETLGGYWSIREYDATNTDINVERRYQLIRRQSYDTAKIWQFQDWYAPGYSHKSTVNYTVQNYGDLDRLPLRDGDLVRVTNNRVQRTVGTYLVSEQILGQAATYAISIADGVVTTKLVSLANGTVQISENLFGAQGFDGFGFDVDSYDYNFGIELRWVIEGLRQDVFVNDLAIYYNLMMFAVIEYILTEQKNIDWMFKTSFISVLHRIQGLLRRPNLTRDRYDFYLKYLEEIKPYRAKIRNYLLSYSEIELPSLSVTDFDLPAYYDPILARFRSPNGEVPYIDSVKFTEPEYQDWYNNHTLSIDQLRVYSGGYGYSMSNPPDLTIVRTDSESAANAQATVEVSSVTSAITKARLTNSGSYLQTPYVDLERDGGTTITDQAQYYFRVTSVGNVNVSVSNVTLSTTTTTGNITANVYTTASDGYVMHRIRRSDGHLVFTRQYNIAQQTSSGYTGYTSRDLADDLNATGADHVVVVHTNGESQPNRFDYGLDSAMYRCGASSEVFGNNTIFRPGGAYSLVGIPGAGPTHGIEIYSGLTDNDPAAFCSIDFRIDRGYLTAVSTNPPIVPLYTAEASANVVSNGSVLSFSFTSLYANQKLYFTVEPATAEDLARIYTTPVTFNTDITPALAEDQPTRSALIVPVMNNNKVRRLRTTMRFDRVATVDTTATVVDWVNGGFDSEPFDYEPQDPTQPSGVFDRTYAAGTIIAYQGQAYRALTEITAAPRLDMTKVVLVGSDLLPTDPAYLHGNFTNANERILAYYQPDATMVPKVLSRLVPGVGQIVSSAESSSINYTETVLIGDTFSSNIGISPGNIQLVGGGFVDALFSYAPEEMLPGMTYDTYTIRIINNASSNVGLRITNDIIGNVSYHSVSPALTTTLAADLQITDANIFVANGSVLPGSVGMGIEPRIIYINGERIAYRTRVGNQLSDLRRSYSGTGAALVHLANSRVEVVSVSNQISGPVGTTPL